MQVEKAFPLRASSIWTRTKEKKQLSWRKFLQPHLKLRVATLFLPSAFEATTPLTSILITALSKIMYAVTFNQSNIQLQLKVKSKVQLMLRYAQSLVGLEPHLSSHMPSTGDEILWYGEPYFQLKTVNGTFRHKDCKRFASFGTFVNCMCSACNSIPKIYSLRLKLW